MRKQLLKNCHEVVIKAGTRLLTDEQRIGELVDGIDLIRRTGRRVLLVSSGAVGMGMRELGMEKRPRELAMVQALAAAGQCKLMSIYSEKCREHGFSCAQLLLTKADLQNRKRYLNVSNCINALWDNDVLPIVNENDSISTDELKFGDNDTLACMLATLTNSHLTVILTTETGLRDRNPDGSLGGRISVVKNIDDSIRSLAGGTDDAEFSIGGMASKLTAAEFLTRAGEYLWIADGREKNILKKIFSGEDVGTLFVPKSRIRSRKRWLRFFARPCGRLTVDDGAAAMLSRRGKSLLCVGIREITGVFKRGDCVEIADMKGGVIAYGLSNFSSEEYRLVAGKQSDELAALLGHPADAEAVHRDNLALKVDVKS